MTTVALGDVVEFYSGGTPSKSKPELWRGNVPWFSAKDMKRPRLRDSADHVTDDVFSSTPLRKLPAGTIAVVVRGMILAHTVPISILEVDAAINQDLKALVPKRDLDTSFLAAMLRAQHATILSQVSTAAHGTKKLDARVLENLRIPFPPVAEQRRIAAILDQADALRAKRRQVLTDLDALVLSTFDSMFDLGELPHEPIGAYVAEQQIGLDRRGAEQGPERPHDYLKMDAITRDGKLDLTSITRVDATPSEVAKYSLRDGDLLFNTRNSRELVGKTAVYRGRPRLYNNNIMRIRLNDALLADYVHRYLWTSEGKHQLDARKAGTTSVFAIYAKTLATLMVPIPSLAIQIEFAERVKKVETQRAAVQRALTADNRLFASLQSRAFRGEL